jgi:hypothetical protein
MSLETTPDVCDEKRVRENVSPPSMHKRQKLDEAEFMVKNKSSPKVDPSELASAFALASLFSMSPPRGETHVVLPPQHSTESRERTTDEDSESSSWEARSPKADAAPASPEQRVPASSSSSSSVADASRHVSFAPHTKEQDQQHHQQQKQTVPLSPMPMLTTTTPQPHVMPNSGYLTSPRGLMLSPRSPQTPQMHQQRGTFMPPSPHPAYGMNAAAAFMRAQQRHLHTPPLHHTPPPLHHYRPHHPYSPMAVSPMPPPWARGRMFPPPPQRLMQPPLMHPENKWICDFCNTAAFATYEDACMHEESCKTGCDAGRPVVRSQHAVTRMMRRPTPQQGPIRTAIATGTAGPAAQLRRQQMQTAPLMMSRSNSAEDEHSTIKPSSSSAEQHYNTGTLSLSIEESDPDWLSELNCFIRKECVEAFSATEDDVSRTSKRGRIALHQVGLRCRFCVHLPLKDKPVAAVSFPTSVSGIYESVKRWQRVHLEVCDEVPQEVQAKLALLANTNVWVPTTRQYWTDSAKALGLIDTSDGIRFGCSPPALGMQTNKIVNLSDHRDDAARISALDKMTSSNKSEDSLTAVKGCGGGMGVGGHIVVNDDIEMIPPYVYYLMHQVESCNFTESDRFVARSKGPVGYPGFQCSHCNGHAGLGKYFPVSAKSFSTNSTSQNIHAHLLKCRKCPDHVKDQLVQLKLEKSRSPRLEPGWRKVFFDKVWARLHG